MRQALQWSLAMLRKMIRYSDLSDLYIFYPVTSESQSPLNKMAYELACLFPINSKCHPVTSRESAAAAGCNRVLYPRQILLHVCAAHQLL